MRRKWKCICFHLLQLTAKQYCHHWKSVRCAKLLLCSVWGKCTFLKHRKHKTFTKKMISDYFNFIFQGKRNKTKVVTYRCPGNTVCQIYNYLTKTARVIFGPELVVLGPHENFHVLSLSGKTQYIFACNNTKSNTALTLYKRNANFFTNKIPIVVSITFAFCEQLL